MKYKSWHTPEPDRKEEEIKHSFKPSPTQVELREFTDTLIKIKKLNVYKNMKWYDFLDLDFVTKKGFAKEVLNAALHEKLTPEALSASQMLLKYSPDTSRY